jgi:hypothetical protein
MNYTLKHFRKVLALLFLVVVTVLSFGLLRDVARQVDLDRSSVITTKATVGSDHTD